MPQKSFLAPAGPVRPLPPDPFNWSVEQVCAFVSLQDAASNRIIRGKLMGTAKPAEQTSGSTSLCVKFIL